MWRWQRASQHSSPEASAGPAVLPAPDGSHSAPAGRRAKESPVPAVAAAWTEACSPVPTPTPTPTTLTGLCGAARGRGRCAITSAVGKPWGWTAGGPRGTQGGVQPPARKEHVRWRWGGFSRVEAGMSVCRAGVTQGKQDEGALREDTSRVGVPANRPERHPTWQEEGRLFADDGVPRVANPPGVTRGLFQQARREGARHKGGVGVPLRFRPSWRTPGREVAKSISSSITSKRMKYLELDHRFAQRKEITEDVSMSQVHGLGNARGVSRDPQWRRKLTGGRGQAREQTGEAGGQPPSSQPPALLLGSGAPDVPLPRGLLRASQVTPHPAPPSDPRGAGSCTRDGVQVGVWCVCVCTRVQPRMRVKVSKAWSPGGCWRGWGGRLDRGLVPLPTGRQVRGRKWTRRLPLAWIFYEGEKWPLLPPGSPSELHAFPPPPQHNLCSGPAAPLHPRPPAWPHLTTGS